MEAKRGGASEAVYWFSNRDEGDEREKREGREMVVSPVKGRGEGWRCSSGFHRGRRKRRWSGADGWRRETKRRWSGGDGRRRETKRRAALACLYDETSPEKVEREADGRGAADWRGNREGEAVLLGEGEVKNDLGFRWYLGLKKKRKWEINPSGRSIHNETTQQEKHNLK